MTTAKHNLFAFLVSLVVLIIYMLVNFQRYIVQYNIRYVMDLYTHSQWSIKDAVRTIGDDGLYQAAAYHMLTTGKIAEINSEAPPAGKYLIMASILIFNNPYYIHPLIYFLCAILVFKITLKLTSPTHAWIALAIFLVQPLIGLQAAGSLLDLPQLLWLLLHLYLLQKFLSADNNLVKSNLRYGLGLGITLGLFAATKFGIFTFVIFLCDIWLLLLSKKLSTAIYIALASAFTYFTMFIPYIIQNGGDFTAWITLEIQRIRFYQQSFTPYLPGSGLISIFTPWHFSWWNTAPQLIREWNLLWPLTGTIIFLAAWQNKQDISTMTKQQLQTQFRKPDQESNWYQATPTAITPNDIFGNYLILLTFMLTIATILVPFWPRYLTPILPLGAIIFALLLHQQKLAILSNSGVKISLLVLFSIIHLANFAYIITPPANDSAQVYAAWFNHSLYYDLYHSLTTTRGLNRTDEEFWKQLIKLESDMQLRGKTAELKLDSPITMPWDTTKRGTLTVKYETPVDTYTHQTPIILQRNFNHWQIVWDWEFILPDYRPTDHFAMTVDPSNSCEIRTDEDRLAARFQPWPVLYIFPNSLYKHPDKQQLYLDIFYLTNINPLAIESLYRANHPEDLYFRLAPLVIEYSEVNLNALLEKTDFQVKEEIVWTISENLSQQQREAAQAVTQQHQLDRSNLNGSFVRQRRGAPDQILIQRNESTTDCLYKI